MDRVKTLVIDNFTGRLTRKNEGDINSGYAKYSTTFGNNPFSNPGNLTWLGFPVAVDSAKIVLTDLIMAMKSRIESGVTYVYAIGHTGRLYKIQVNNPTTNVPSYNNPVLLTTLTSNSPTFKYGSSIQFYGATEKIFIGHDIGVTKVNFDGSGETFVGVAGSYTANVPRPSSQFVGKLYFGNGSNLVEIDSTETVISYSKLSPAFPAGTYTRDLDTSSDGVYLETIVSRVNSPDRTSIAQDTTPVASTDAYKFLWNGTDIGYTSFETYTGYSISSNISFGQNHYTMGYDMGGGAIYSGDQKLASLPNTIAPNFGAMFSIGNIMGFVAPDFNTETRALNGSIFMYGQYDQEIPTGLYRIMRSNGDQVWNPGTTDIISMPACVIASNLLYGSSLVANANKSLGHALLYFSSLELDSVGSPSYRLYSIEFFPASSLENLPAEGVYETQNQLFSKKVRVTEARFYVDPLLDLTTFNIKLIGSGGTIPGTEIDFVVGTNAAIGQDWVKYTPQMAPTYTLGVRISNNNLNANFTVNKVEIDYVEAGTI